jgi:hypothetical protein
MALAALPERNSTWNARKSMCQEALGQQALQLSLCQEHTVRLIPEFSSASTTHPLHHTQFQVHDPSSAVALNQQQQHKVEQQH